MKHLKLKIPLVIFSSIVAVFAVSFFILNVLLPGYFRRQAETTLTEAVHLFRPIYSIDSEDDFTSSESTAVLPEIATEIDLLGNVNYMHMELYKPEASGDMSVLIDLLPDSGNIARRSAEETIRDYYNTHPIVDGQCYAFRAQGGYYVFLPFSDGTQTAALYLDIQPFLQYTGMLNRILLLAFVLVTLIMCAIGVRLGGRIEESQHVRQQFFQNASHELKTPLMSIQGYAEGIRTGVLPVESAADVILEESDHMTTLVEELLTLSLLESHGITAKMSRCDVREILDDCMVSVAPLAGREGIAVRAEFDEQELPVMCASGQLRQAFLNILSNALRYAGTQIVISCHAERGQTVVSVTDDGGGLSEEDLPHIFDRFYTGACGNTGIGLALTREIVVRHRGTVRACNRDGGACFEVRLPSAQE